MGGCQRQKEADNFMLDIKRIRREADVVEELLKRRGEISLSPLLAVDERRRALITESEQLKAKQNADSKKIPQLKKEGKDTSQLLEEMKELSEQVKLFNVTISELDEQMEQMLLTLPNIPNAEIPIGPDDSWNREVRKVGTVREFDFEPKAHWDIGVERNLLDFERAVKIAGARFSMFTGVGAKLERALINFMLTLHTEKQGYTEISPPFMVNRQTMTATGQLPKFEEDAFNIKNNDYFLIPTAEVPVTNIYRDEILPESMLPVRFTAYTPCFRAEAGSAGRDTRGLIRNHQFDKVELVQLVHPDHSYDVLEKLTNDAEEVLQLLGLPYRVMELSTGDIGFSSAKTYDLEVWMPSYGRYVEISSCSNFEDFQARRGNIRFRDENGQLRFVHTLNGSGLAVGRTFAALLENFQNKDGSVTIPEVLQSYIGNLEQI
jgi:seryl-tRNA synthetase